MPADRRLGNEDGLHRMAVARRGNAEMARRAGIVPLTARTCLPPTEIARGPGTSVPAVREWRSR